MAQATEGGVGYANAPALAEQPVSSFAPESEEYTLGGIGQEITPSSSAAGGSRKLSQAPSTTEAVVEVPVISFAPATEYLAEGVVDLNAPGAPGRKLSQVPQGVEGIVATEALAPSAEAEEVGPTSTIIGQSQESPNSNVNGRKLSQVIFDFTTVFECN